MTSLVDIAEALAGALSETSGWRLIVKSQHSVKAGVDDSRLGGAYAPAAAKDEISGEVFIIWKDGTCSRGRINSGTADRLKESMDLWRSMAYRDSDIPQIAELAPPIEVELCDPRVADMVIANSKPIFEAMSEIRSAALGSGSRVFDIRAEAGCCETILATSSGLWVKYPETASYCYWELEKTFSGARFGRRFEAWHGLSRSVARTGELVQAARVPGHAQSADTFVLIAPDVADGFIGHYLASSFLGESVAEGRSRYSLSDFEAGKKVFDGADLVVDTGKPFGPGSSPCTVEGVPSSRKALTSGGRLVTPILNLKYARKCQMAPTPIPSYELPAGHGGLELLPGREISWDQAVSQIENGFLVCSVLGMHTQDPVSGNFSLAVPEGILIRDGKLVGSVKAVISGNFFDALSSCDTVYVRDEEHPNPGIGITCHVEVGS